MELVCIDIALDFALISQYQASPRVGHLEAIYLIFNYLSKHKNWCIVFDATLPEIKETYFIQDADWIKFYHYSVEEDTAGMPEPLEQEVVISAFVDLNHARNKTRQSYTGVFIFVSNSMITVFSKHQNTVESSTFGSELVAMRSCRDLLVAL